MSQAYCLVVGNEKGGSGKSTTAMHITIALMRMGYKVGCLDVDGHQGTLAHYIDNRRRVSQMDASHIPDCQRLYPADDDSIVKAHKNDEDMLGELMSTWRQQYDFIVIDTPGHRLHLSRLAHQYADTLITPINDSFVDIDVIARINANTLEMDTPSTYAHWVWEMKKNCAAIQHKSLDWIVMRNRLSNIYDKNKSAMEKALRSLSKRLGFRVVAGFSERVIFKEFFLKGLTLFDLKAMGGRMTLSHVAAKSELYALLRSINLDSLREAVSKVV